MSKLKLAVPLPEEFTDKVRIQGDTECWPWLGDTSAWGYGVNAAGRQAHVWSYALRYGEGQIKPGFQLFQTCLNKLCMNPKHMRLRKKW